MQKLNKHIHIEQPKADWVEIPIKKSYEEVLVGNSVSMNPEWIYRNKFGTYTESSLLRLVWAIVAHRYSHWRKGEGWTD